MWSLSEQDALEKALLTHSPLRSALEKFFAERADRRRRDCMEMMASVPRQYEHAANYAAQAQVYDSLISELERALDQDPAGPTG